MPATVAVKSKFSFEPKSREKHIHIAFSTNDNYAPHTGAAIASLLSNNFSKREINIHILYSEMSNESIHALKLLCKLRTHTFISFIKINIDEFQSFPLQGGIQGLETYFRLKLPTILPKVKKVIYLDSDIIVICDIEKLWNYDMGENFILAVEEPTHLHKKRLKKLGMKETSPYFNAGVILMNLSKMRNSEFHQKLIPFVEKRFNVLKLRDQDILNTFFEGQWHPLPLDFNAFWCLLYRAKNNKFTFYTDEDFKQARRNPFIIHFNINTKPWEAGCIDPRRRLYWKYQDLTTFGFPRPDKRTDLIKFLINKILYYLKKYTSGTWIAVAVRKLKIIVRK